MIFFVNSVKKSMKIVLLTLLIFLNGCLPVVFVAPGFYIGAADVTVKSKEILSGNKCEWRCYKSKKK
jgi:hypothetical protein